MRWELLVIAVAVVINGLLGRYEMSAGSVGVFKVDRLTGKVERCYSMKEGTGFILCGDSVDERRELESRK